MSGKMITFSNGVELSEETVMDALEKNGIEVRKPIFAATDDRLVMKMTPTINKTLRSILAHVPNNQYCAITPDGRLAATCLKTWKDVRLCYPPQPTPLFD